MAKQVFRLDFCGRVITVETGEIAKQAGGSAIVRYEDTVVLSTATASNQPKEGIDFFPLTVSFEEKLYSVGKIPGGFLRREGRPSEHATLTARMIDRPIRPLFAEGFRNEVQVVNTVLSVDQDCTPEMTAMLGASLALCISDIPFNGPIAGVQVGRIDGEYIINPSVEQAEKSDISLTVAGTKYAINMVEAGAKEVSEEDMLGALMFGHEHIKKLCEFQEEIIAAVGKEKREITLYTIDEQLDAEVRAQFEQPIREAVSIEKKLERYGKIDELTQQAVDLFEAREYASEKEKNTVIKQVKEICHSIEADEVRRLIVEDKIRPDGRKINEIRPLDSQVDLLPRVHGSAMFTRGETQVLSVTTLGAINDNQIIDDLTEVECKRFMHHYNFPPYSVGETGRMGSPGRREIGHGALGERALLQVLPPLEKFPYTIRTVAEVLESNGSSSMATVCAGTLALRDAGVPMKKPVSGIAMGLISENKGTNYAILSDILGDEDHLGDMDFKVTGTKDGITATQMDIKVDGLSYEILENALAQAKEGRMHILGKILEAQPEAREDLKPHAPRIETMIIGKEFIGAVIGPGGKIIQGIQEKTGATVSIDEVDGVGKIEISGTNKATIDAAVKAIKAIVAVPEIGEVYEGKISSIMPYGAFVEFMPGKDGLLHISEIDWKRLETVEQAGLKEGDTVSVKLVDIDPKTGKFKLSRKVLLPKPEGYEERPPRPERGERGPRQDRGDRGPRQDRGDRGPRREYRD